MGLIANPFNKPQSSQMSQLQSQKRVMTLDDFSDSESSPSLRVKSNEMCELSFVFDGPNNPEQQKAEEESKDLRGQDQRHGLLSTVSPMMMQPQQEQLMASPEEGKLDFSPIATRDEDQNCANKPLGMRRVKRFLNLE